tara:strand:+ start:3274 stop:3576 length:303 start_codon:yes stop_codon:yes gene_type:complete
MQSISPQDLKNVLTDSQYQIIDVREPYEFEDFNIGGLNIPLDNVLSSIDEIDTSKNVVICCQSGNRSKAMIMTLERKFKLTNLWTLEGGVTAFKELTAEA